MDLYLLELHLKTLVFSLILARLIFGFPAKNVVYWMLHVVCYHGYYYHDYLHVFLFRSSSEI